MNSESPLHDMVKRAADLIRAARCGIALTGAGISTPSGIPDFRSPESGLWNFVDPFEVASLSSFRRAPKKFYDWIRPFASLMLNAAPNPAHEALASLQQRGFIHAIITQNIDGLHQKAGSEDVYELHGTINHLTCVSCYKRVDTAGIVEEFMTATDPPHCHDCGGILKLDVILFDEQLPFESWMKAEEASKTCDLMMVIGSSLEMLPVSKLPLNALDRGVPLILINLSETFIDERAEVVIPGDVAEVLPALAKAVLVA